MQHFHVKEYWLLLCFLFIAAIAYSGEIRSHIPGFYTIGFGLAIKAQLTLEADNRFRYSVSGDMFPSDTEHTNKGIYRLEGQSIFITADNPIVGSDSYSLKHQYTIVPWGDRLYLIPAGEMLHFCNNVNLGGEDSGRSSSMYLVKSVDQSKAQIGLPQVTGPWKEYLLTEPVKASVISVDNSGKAEIDRGIDAGLKNEMILIANKSDKRMAVVRIVDVRSDRSTVIIVEDNDRIIEVGIHLTTRAWP